MGDIPEIDGWTPQQIHEAVQAGGRFVRYEYVISILIMTFTRSSRIHFVKADGNRLVTGLPYTALTLALGWWGVPWGVIRTPLAALKNLAGGDDVTAQVWRA